MRNSRTVSLVSQTQPVWPIPALWIHYKSIPVTPAEVEEVDRIEDELRARFTPAAIDVPKNVACSIVTVAPLNGTYIEGTVVEISPILERGAAGNPTDGVAVRISNGGRPGASFYWVPLLDCTTKGCRAGDPVGLDVHDG